MVKKNKFKVLDDVADKGKSVGMKTEKIPEKIDDLLMACDEWLELCKLNSFEHGVTRYDYSDAYGDAAGIISYVDYELEDIVECSSYKYIQRFFHTPYFNRIGLFLSAGLNMRMNDSSDILLDVSQYSRPPEFLGFKHYTGRLTVKGDTCGYLGHLMSGGEIVAEDNTGTCLGAGMKEGTIIVKGNANVFAGGNKRNGNIIIHGNSGDYTADHQVGGRLTVMGKAGKMSGYGMSGGELIVNDADEDLGEGLCGGEIIIKNSYTTIGKDKIGKIYYNDKLIFDE